MVETICYIVTFPRADLDEADIKTVDGKNATGDITIHYVNIQPTPGAPVVHFIKRPGEFALPVTSGTFDVLVQISEEPKASTFTKDHFSITNATITQVTALGAFDADAGFVSTGRDGKVYRYLLTVLPAYKNDEDIVIKIEAFEDQEKPTPMKYTPPATDAGRTESQDMLTVKVDRAGMRDRPADTEVSTPKTIIILNADDFRSAQNGGGDNTEAAAPKAEKDETPDTSVMIPMQGQIYISEIMFAGGGFLPQWIEISNGSRTEQVNLNGWTLTIENATADADVFVSEKAKYRIPEGTKINPSGQYDTPSTLLVVAKQGRNNLDAGPGTMGEDQVVNLDISRPRYALLSDVAFKTVQRGSCFVKRGYILAET